MVNAETQESQERPEIQDQEDQLDPQELTAMLVTKD